MLLISSSHFQRSTKKTATGMPKVLVLDANQRSALAVIRSLGRRGLTVVVGDSTKKPLGAASRYAASSVVFPDPATAPGQFCDEIGASVVGRAIEFVIPATDLTTMLLVSQPNLAKIVRLGAPPPKSYEALTDKAHLMELARSLNIRVPETRIARSMDDVLHAVRDFGFPVVLKPARSRYLREGQVLSTSVEIVHSQKHLSQALKGQGWFADIPCLVQRFVPGHGAGIFALYGPTGPIAWFAHRRLREKPPGGGVSVLCESVQINTAMQTAASKLLSAAGWTGVAMIEFRVAADGTPYLMEVNGRFWGSLQLAIDCGVDFPWLLYQLTDGLPTTPPKSYASGRRLRWLLGDLDRLILELRDSKSPPSGKMSVLVGFLRTFADFSCRQEVLRLSDPAPGLREAVQWFNALRNRLP